MRKQRSQLIGLLVILVVLCGGFFGIKQYNRIQAEKPEEDDSTIIVDISSEDVVRFAYDYEGEAYTFEKKEDTWYYAEDHSLNMTQYRITNMLSNVTPLRVSNVIEDVTDMAQYGLKEPSRSIRFETATESYIFYVGDYNAMSSVYYICSPSGTTVYTVSGQTINGFNYALEDLVEVSTEESSVEESDTEESNTEENGAEESGTEE